MLIYIVNVLIYIVNTKKCVDLHSKYEGKSIQIYANHHHHRKFGKHFTFFQFSQWIFYEFSKFLMFWKEDTLLVILSFISIYEICRQVRVLLAFVFFVVRFPPRNDFGTCFQISTDVRYSIGLNS